MSLLDRVRQTQRVKRAARASRLPGGPAGIPGTGSPPRPWWVEIRMQREDYERAKATGLVIERASEVPDQPFGVARTHVALWDVTVEVDATSEAIAERLGRRIFERLGIAVVSAGAYQRSARR